MTMITANKLLEILRNRAEEERQAKEEEARNLAFYNREITLTQAIVDAIGFVGFFAIIFFLCTI